MIESQVRLFQKKKDDALLTGDVFWWAKHISFELTNKPNSAFIGPSSITKLKNPFETMHKLLSNRCTTLHSTVPESYILPPERRPSAVPPCKTIPVIDLRGLNCDRTNLVQQIIKASQEYGFFQVINHCFFFLVSLEL